MRAKDASSFELLKVKRATPFSSCPATNWSRSTLSAGFSTDSEPMKPFLRMPAVLIV